MPDLLTCGLYFNDMSFSGLPECGVQPGREVRTGPFRHTPGGIANVSIAAARLGMRVCMAADVGDDVFTVGSLASLAAEGISAHNCITHDGWQTPLTVILNYGGDRSMVTAETPHPGACVMRSVELCRAKVAVAHLQPFAMPWLARAASRGTKIIGDVGWDEAEEWDLTSLPDLRHCYSFTPNLTEALHYTRTDAAEDALRVLREWVPLPVITLGGDGAVALDPVTGDVVGVPAVPGEVVDTGGAGDVFEAGLAYGLERDWPIERTLRLAVLVAGLTVRSPGGATTAPSKAELVEWWRALDLSDDLRKPYAFVRRWGVHG